MNLTSIAARRRVNDSLCQYADDRHVVPLSFGLTACSKNGMPRANGSDPGNIRWQSSSSAWEEGSLT